MSVASFCLKTIGSQVVRGEEENKLDHIMINPLGRPYFSQLRNGTVQGGRRVPQHSDRQTDIVDA